MHNLGQSRSSHQRNHILQTPDTFVRTALPGMKNASAIVHIGPALGAAFTEYTAEFEPKGELGNTAAQRFIYVMDGAVALEAKGERHELGARGYAYLPEGFSHRVVAKEKSRVAVVEKQYERNAKIEPPHLLVSNENAISAHALDGDSDLQVKCLLPDEPQFDFAVNTMVYQPVGKVPAKYLIYKNWNRHPLGEQKK